MRQGRAGALACALLLAVACVEDGRRPPPHPGIARLWRHYLALPPKRALAIAGDPAQVWVGAAAGGAELQADASDRALEECRRKRSQRRMQAPCLLFAVGDDVLWKRF